MLLPFDDNESLLKISGGDLSLFVQSTRDFLTLTSKSETSEREANREEQRSGKEQSLRIESGG